MKVVQFEDGSYAIRKGVWPFFVYRDLVSPRYSWGKRSEHFRDCLTHDKDKICKTLNWRVPKKTFTPEQFCRNCEMNNH